MRITVKLQDGQIGTIEDQEYNPQTMERLDTPAQAMPQQTQQVPAQKNLLQSLLDPFIKTGKQIGGAGFELGRAGLSAMGNKDVYYNQKTQQTVQNPFLSEQELAKTSSDPLGAILEQAKQSAAVASYAVPFGKGAGLLQKVLYPGAAVGALSSLSEAKNVGDVATSAAFGAGGAGLLHGGVKAIGGGVNLVNKIINAGKGRIANEAAQGISKASPTVWRKALEEHGFDVNTLIKKYVPPGADYNTMLGDATKRGGGGVLGFNMGQAEQTIKRAVNAAGATIRVSGDDFVKALESERNLLKKTVGNETKVNAINNIILETQKLFKNGISTKRLLDLKRAADSQFGRAVLEEQTGSVAASAQKIIANIARRKLKEILPTVKNALDTETELYTLKPILNHARSIMNTSGSEIRLGKLSNIDITKPGTLFDVPMDAVMRNPKIASRLLNPKTSPPAKASSGNPILNQILGQASARGYSGLSGGQPSDNQGIDNEQYQKQNDISNNNIQDSSSISQPVNNQQKALEGAKVYLTMKMIEDAQSGGKNISKLQAIAGAIEKLAPNEGKSIPVALKQRQDLSTAGLRAQSDALEIFKADPNIVIKKALSGGLLSRKFDSAMSRAVEGLLRARSGAAVPDSEVKKYIKDYGPRIGDTEDVALYKLEQLRLDLQDALNTNGNITGDLVAQP